AAVRRHLVKLADRNAHDAAVVVLDNASGEVLAYVGSSGALSEAGAVDAARAPRQAGSTLKPFIYGLAIEKKLVTAATLLDDAPLAVDVGGGTYAPQNYAEDYVGPVSVRTALASSLNIPAIRALSLVGVAPVHRLLREAGLSTLVADPEHYGHSLALGSADVTLLDLTNAYRALAQGGLVSPVRWRPEEAAGTQREALHHVASGMQSFPRRVLSPAAAWIVGDILADRGARYLTFGFDNPLAVNHWAAVKTGTSKDMRDNWAIGWNARVTVGVWVGNAQGHPMHGVTGISGAGPIWAEVIEAAAARYGAGPPPAAPAEVVFAAVGQAGPGAVQATARARPRREAFLAGTVPAHGIVAAREASEVGARIISPVDGTIIALDPDLPEAHERVPLVASAPALANCFRLDTLPARSALLGCAERVLWRPEPGEHALVLLDAEGRERDRIRLIVRGR
ncbi:MAG: penicillin-binding transpeptidase domain-containing protein, partial [Casimicrobiaceae bacterium]